MNKKPTLEKLTKLKSYNIPPKISLNSLENRLITCMHILSIHVHVLVIVSAPRGQYENISPSVEIMQNLYLFCFVNSP